MLMPTHFLILFRESISKYFFCTTVLPEMLNELFSQLLFHIVWSHFHKVTFAVFSPVSDSEAALHPPVSLITFFVSLFGEILFSQGKT